ncbi:MAG TPA: 16S rRNA (cytosine(1402)-N(4))-methyltransferase RsmH [Spirochaetota bacterium]|nr:16S rRNA (cytosine(1402)-N(4))-methyltransferase RsmH [Spirochaetota bacterium]
MRHNTDDDPSGPFAHTPVMHREVMEYIAGISACDGSVVVDCTLGEGGHSELILSGFPDLSVVAFERDPEILAIADARLSVYGNRFEVINDNFANAGENMAGMEGRVRCFLYDFGISSFHLDKSGRGFSFRSDEPLDMRLDPRLETDAARIVNTRREKELTDILLGYGEERWAKRIARRIVERRGAGPITTTGELAELVLRAIPVRYHVRNIHPATRVFQALRIAVNDELAAIRASLRDAARLLAEGGRIIAISFHSLEDRVVKDSFRRMAAGCKCGEEPRHCRCTGSPLLRILTKKPLVPGDAELTENRRSRSAKMRVCEKIGRAS